MTIERSYYMVRAMDQNKEHFDEFFNNEVVAIGWSDVNFSEYKDIETLRYFIRDKYYGGDTNRTITKNLNAIQRFKSIKKGDYIIIPYYSNIVIAIAEGIENYSINARQLDLSNQHKVSYIKNSDGQLLLIPREDLPEGLQRRLKVPGSKVSDLFEFKDKIEKLFEIETYTYSYSSQLEEQDQIDQFKMQLLKNIREGETYLKAGGIGLEHLVKELLEIEGYNTKILSTRNFNVGDADIAAFKEDAFSSSNILIQVKHHNGTTGEHGLTQIVEALKDSRYLDYSGCLLTSADVDEELRQKAAIAGINIIDGENLVEILYNNLENLSDETKIKLRIQMIPKIF